MVFLTTNRCVSEDTSCFLEGSRWQETIGFKRGFGDSHKDRTSRRRNPTRNNHITVGICKVCDIHESTHEKVCISWIHDTNLTDHLTHHYLDVFVADFYPLATVYFLYFRKEVSFNRQDITNGKETFWLDRTFCQCCTTRDLISHFDFHAGCVRDNVFSLTSRTTNKDFLGTCRSIFFNGCDFPFNLSDDRFPFRIAGFKDFLDTRKTLRDIGIWGNPTRVEGTHCKLCTRFPDRLGCDGSDCFTHFNCITSRQVDTVTVTADTMAGVTCKDRTDSDFFNTSIDNFTC